MKSTTQATLVKPLIPALVRSRFGVIIGSFGTYEQRQSIDLWVEAHKTDSDGDTESEVIKLTVGLNGPVKPLILDYIKLNLPGYQLHDWQTWVEPSDEAEPF